MGGFLLSSTTNAIGIHPAAGCSTGRDIPEEAEEHQQDAAGCSIGRNISGGGRGTSTGGSRTHTGRNISGADGRILHRQRYVRRRQQDTPQAGIYRRRQQETAGDTTGNTQAGIYRRRQQNIKRSKKNK